mgnify:CR=1 FL=1
MGLRLSQAEVEALLAAQRALLSPAEHAEVREWQRAVNRAVCALIGADKAGFYLGLPDGTHVFSEEYDVARVAQYPTYVEPLQRKYHLFERQVELGAWMRDQLHAPYLPEYYRSAYYHEYIVPLRAYDAVGLTVTLPASSGSSEMTYLLCHHDQPGAWRRGDATAELLRPLLPALRAGVEACRRLRLQANALAGMLDALHEGLLLFARDGHLLHANPAALALLAADADAARLRALAAACARALLPLLAGAADARPLQAAAGAERELRTAHAAYRLRATLLREGLVTAQPAVLVALQRLTPAAPCAATVRARFGLSQKEAEVAVHLARGESNDAIARALFISPHTARHHVEKILLKLGASSRAAAAARIAGSG